MSMKRFAGKVAIITGSSKGLGYAIAQRLGEEGAKVMISSSKEKNVNEAVKKLKELGIEASGTVCDISKKEDAINLVKTCISRYGQLDILVPNAALSFYVGNLLQIPEDAYEKHMDANLKSGFWLAREAEPHLEKTKGTIIFIGSVLAYTPSSCVGMGIYSITKTALLAMVKVLGSELASKGIRVNAINPGGFDTDMSKEIDSKAYSGTPRTSKMECLASKSCDSLAEAMNQTAGKQVVSGNELYQKLAENTALKRYGKPHEIGGAVAFLASDDASYMIGEAMVVGGGWDSRL